jgi:hypothetical protein
VQNHVAEDVLGLSSKQAVVVAGFILAEARGSSSSDDVVPLIRRRLELLQACCCSKRHLVLAVINHLAAFVKDGRFVKLLLFLAEMCPL